MKAGRNEKLPKALPKLKLEDFPSMTFPMVSGQVHSTLIMWYSVVKLCMLSYAS